jgi:anhydro-N-acetylmuramic acid kinase
MNKNIEHIYSIAKKKSKLIIGLMSGTSLDGLDIALCRFEGAGLQTKIEVLQFETVAYTENFKEEVLAVFSKKQVSLEKLCLLNAWIGTTHANMINNCLQKWNVPNDSVDLIASHGQTIYHAPKKLHQQDKFNNATLQIGDGDHIAVKTGIITISDFRQKHIAFGGEGAPLAVYGDFLLFSKKDENRIMLNIGGIANYTFLSGDLDASKNFSTDTGPGNTLMDAYIRKYFFEKQFDKNAEIALQGAINNELLNTLKKHTFFNQSFPKTTGPELFNLNYLEQAQQQTNTIGLSNCDVMATLNRFTAETIADAIQKGINEKKFVVYSSGGGIHNSLLMQHLKELMPNIVFRTTKDLQINPDAKEAILFAILANECVSGDTSIFSKSKLPNISMGKISFPN